MSIRAQGLRTWLWQRFSAVYIASYLIYVLFNPAIGNASDDFVSWRELFREPFFFVTSALFVLALFVHAWVGGRDVLMDYVKAGAPRFLALNLFALLLLTLGFWLLYIVVPVVIS